jgi:hypothetical protein
MLGSLRHDTLRQLRLDRRCWTSRRCPSGLVTWTRVETGETRKVARLGDDERGIVCLCQFTCSSGRRNYVLKTNLDGYPPGLESAWLSRRGFQESCLAGVDAIRSQQGINDRAKNCGPGSTAQHKERGGRLCYISPSCGTDDGVTPITRQPSQHSAAALHIQRIPNIAHVSGAE